MEPPITYYQQRATQFKQLVTREQKRYMTVSVFRLISFVAFLFAAWRYFNRYDGFMLVFAIVAITAFIVLVRIAFRIKERKSLYEKLHFINENEVRVLQHEPNRFSGTAGQDTDGNYAADLDVFGPRSLYHLLNRTTTQHGATQLAALLQDPLMTKVDIEAQQRAISVLSSQAGLRQLITAHGLLHEESEGNLHHVQSWVLSPAVIHKQGWLRLMRYALPAYNLAALVFYLYSDNYFPLVAGVLVSWGIIGAFAKRVNSQHALLGKKQSILEQYAAILVHFSRVDAQDAALLRREQLQAQEAYSAIRKLSKLASLFDQRLNFLVNLFLNSFFLYDVQCLWALERWKLQHSRSFGRWIECVGSIETLNSLATFAYNNPAYVYPVIQENDLVIRAENLAHPLIPGTERVGNDCTIGRQEKLILVTGSNMSGKTTFLRTLGVNLLLAQCGAPVCATGFVFTPVHMRTSIRVSDSLQEHTSYFMAELKRLQQIIRHLEQCTTPTLVLIDEILRGTNSEDKTHGSEQFIRKLLQYRCITLFATHDLALSRLENELPGQVNNYCFESTISNGELYFDYKLHRGVARNKNASFLMKKMDII